MEYIKRFMLPKDKNTLTPKTSSHQDLNLEAMSLKVCARHKQQSGDSLNMFELESAHS